MKAFHISYRGSSHIRKGQPMQDASASFANKDLAVIAVADGHGSEDCFRSDIGSRLAVETAVDVLKELASKSDVSDLLANDKVAIDNLKKTIIEEWKARVDKHLALLPFFEEELSRISSKQKSRIESGRVYPAYGSTLVATLVTSTFWVALQIGDGYLWASPKGSGKWRWPLPEDPNCIGNCTTSICDKGAVASMHVLCSNKLPGVVAIGTDGVLFSSRDDEKKFLSLATSRKTEVSKDVFVKEISDHMMFRSYKGTADDISFAMIFND